MGKASTRKWENRIARTRKEMAEALRRPDEPSTALRWLRSAGLTSLLLGGLGLMQTFFWQSVFAIYIGTLLILLDVYWESFKPKWLRLALMAAILVIGGFFTQAIVLRKSSVMSVFIIQNDKLVVSITNDSEDDYELLDVKIKPDFPDDFISEAAQRSSVPGVSFGVTFPVIMTDKGRKRFIYRQHKPS